jgi:hypothetical protein
MRSPQLGQKIVSLKVFPLASVGGNGYHLRPMDARAWTVRLDVGVGLAMAISPAAHARTPTPTPTPSGAPKILLAFDASGSMLTDDGNGTRKIDAANDATVDHLDYQLDIQSPLREPLGEEFDWGDASADLEGDPELAIELVAVLALLGGIGLGALASRLLVHP